MSNDKIFVGSVKAETINKGNNGPWEKIRISIGPKDFQTLQENRNNQGWVNLLFKKGMSGNYYMEVDTFKPKESFEQPNYSSPPPPMDDGLEPLPF